MLQSGQVAGSEGVLVEAEWLAGGVAPWKRSVLSEVALRKLNLRAGVWPVESALGGLADSMVVDVFGWLDAASYLVARTVCRGWWRVCRGMEEAGFWGKERWRLGVEVARIVANGDAVIERLKREISITRVVRATRWLRSHLPVEAADELVLERRSGVVRAYLDEAFRLRLELLRLGWFEVHVRDMLRHVSKKQRAERRVQLRQLAGRGPGAFKQHGVWWDPVCLRLRRDGPAGQPAEKA
jgi:hypothetical protein